jgi:hypothetical protein
MIQGWKSIKFDTNTYLVSCTFELRGQIRGFYFEVNLNTETVRHIFANSPLAKRYRIDSAGLFDPGNAGGTLPDWLLKGSTMTETQNHNMRELWNRDRIATEPKSKPREFWEGILMPVESQSDHNRVKKNSSQSGP